MSVIFFVNTTLEWVGDCISIFKATPTGPPGAYQFNVAANSMLAPTVAAWPLSPLAVP